MQVNFALMFYINEISISSQWYKKRFYDFFNSDVTAFYEVSLNTLLIIAGTKWSQKCHED